jgi:aryl-alcohol dehydrogenase-like predicted oxidoreductase
MDRTSGSDLPTRPLGRTGVEISLVALGGYHLGIPDEAEALRIVDVAVERGVTFLDNCWDYHEGRSEERMGKALAGGRRQRVILMTKIDGRTRRAAAEQLEQSLARLGTDMIDVVQIHEIIRMDDAERCFAEGGAIEALVEARRAGKLRFIGFTGHKDPAIHNHMLDVAARNGFGFDTVQMPLNVLDPHHRSFEAEVLPRLVAAGTGVLAMKPLAAGLIPKRGLASKAECLRYAMSLPVSTVITGCQSVQELEEALAVAGAFQPLDEAERSELLARTAGAGRDGGSERFKTSGEHDGTEQNRHWLEEARI